jgi:hypothetical protein
MTTAPAATHVATDLAASLRELLDTSVPLVVIETHDERRVLSLAESVARPNKREVWTWSASRGLRAAHNRRLKLTDAGDDIGTDAAATKPLPEALEAIDKLEGGALVLLLDVHPYLSNPVIARALKELALKGEHAKDTMSRPGAPSALKGPQVVLVGHAVEVPDELLPYCARFELEPMTLERVRAVFDEELVRHKHRSGQDVQGSRSVFESLMRQLVGLPEASVHHLARVVLADGKVSTPDLARVMRIKAEQSGAAELLSFEPHLPSMDDVAGMAALKRWLQLRRRPFLEPHDTGLPVPRGVMLLGVQGAGKSLAAKAIAASWQVPLFRMDFGALFDKYQGESERKMREALRVADAMQPCVVWMDEIEKGIAGGADSGGDGMGTGQRLLGTLLTWMAERKASVFLVATANDVTRLPPELIRKGRFDEIFFVDLPHDEVRHGILSLHLNKRKVSFDGPALAPLVQASRGFSGAEIEAAIVAACYEAHNRQAPPDAALVHGEIARTKPLSVTRREAIDALRAWAADRTVSVD